MKPLFSSPDAFWKLFEKSFKFADYGFKYFGWVLLTGTSEYLGIKYDLSGLIIASKISAVILGFLAGLFTTHFVFFICEAVKDRRIYFACVVSLWILSCALIVFLQNQLLLVANDLAAHK